jgi:hypothetical protein
MPQSRSFWERFGWGRQPVTDTVKQKEPATDKKEDTKSLISDLMPLLKDLTDTVKQKELATDKKPATD